MDNPRKFFIDSRARRSGTHSDFVWQCDRPMMIDRGKAYIDSVHVPQVFGSINATNPYFYVTEEQSDFDVIPGQNKLYITEEVGAIKTERIVSLTVGSYATEAIFATWLGTALGASYTVTQSAANRLTIATTLTAFTIHSRRELLTLPSFAGQSLTTLDDASDLIGTTISPIYHIIGHMYLAHSKLYRRVVIPEGYYVLPDLATALATTLNANTTLPQNYVVTQISATGKLSITNASTLLFEVYSEKFLKTLPYFGGHQAPWYAADEATGFMAATVAQGNSVTSSEHVSMMRYHTIFINSDLGSHNDTVGPMNQSTIARKVVIDQAHGGMIHDYHMLAFDYIQLDKQSLSAIRFRLTDWQGHPVPMPIFWSLSLIIIPDELL